MVDASAERKHFEKLLSEFGSAMLVTHADDGHLRARPLSLAKAHDDGIVYFATSVESAKVSEVEANPSVAVTLQDGRRYVSLSGTARISHDRALIDRLWSESWKLWFPAGKDDPALCIVVVTPREAEYWDQTGLAGVRFVLEAAKAYVTRTTPASGESSDHAKVRL